MVMGMQKPEAVCAEPKVFVGQVPHEVTQEQVFSLFSKYGTIKKCALITGQDGRSKGCAMVTFERWAEAELAIEHENGTANLGGGRTLLVKFADPPRGRGDGPVMGVAPKKLFVGQVLVPSRLTLALTRPVLCTCCPVCEMHLWHVQHGVRVVGLGYGRCAATASGEVPRHARWRQLHQRSSDYGGTATYSKVYDNKYYGVETTSRTRWLGRS